MVAMFSLHTFTSIVALASLSAFAAPSPRDTAADFDLPTGCSVSASVLQDLLPSNQTALIAPSSAPRFVALGVGVQNYTCSSTGTFSNIGAIAELFDISCIASEPVQLKAYEGWSASSQTALEFIDTIGHRSFVLGQHYFIANPTAGGANEPKFDFTNDRLAGDTQAFAVSSRAGDIVAPTGSGDIDWLLLNTTSGDLAQQIFRIATVGGTDASACTAGETASVKYVAKYFFY
ncbi:unnamed protein product [Peniophora sp. CBMAI 1063]|nr:unnamed protein product [Peniophora sp. CBMAI 1063]